MARPRNNPLKHYGRPQLQSTSPRSEKKASTPVILLCLNSMVRRPKYIYFPGSVLFRSARVPRHGQRH
jgi:hypothetical protein